MITFQTLNNTVYFNNIFKFCVNHCKCNEMYTKSLSYRVFVFQQTDKRKRKHQNPRSVQINYKWRYTKKCAYK